MRKTLHGHIDPHSLCTADTFVSVLNPLALRMYDIVVVECEMTTTARARISTSSWPTTRWVRIAGAADMSTQNLDRSSGLNGLETCAAK